MTPELTYLALSAALTLLQSVVAVLGAVAIVGLPALAGNRENLPPITGWADRAARAHRNMLETLVLFAIAIVVAHVAGRTNAQTALGAVVFFWARVAYAIVYIVGIPWLRTAVWAVSIAGLLLVLAQLL